MSTTPKIYGLPQASLERAAFREEHGRDPRSAAELRAFAASMQPPDPKRLEALLAEAERVLKPKAAAKLTGSNSGRVTAKATTTDELQAAKDIAARANARGRSC